MLSQIHKVKISNTCHLSLPRDICESLGIKPGDMLNIESSGHGFTLSKEEIICEPNNGIDKEESAT